MVDAGIYTSLAQVAVKAGANVNATAITEAEVNKHVLMVESFINCATRYNWSDEYSTLNVDVKSMLSDISSNLCAIYAIKYDYSGFPSRNEAESMIAVLRDAALRGLSVLRDKKTQEFMKDA